jgi:lipopolysaccharide transport system permease protein
VAVSAPARSTVALRDFIWTLVRTDFKARYHGAAGGFAWALLKPLAMFFVLYHVFSFLFRDPTYMLNLLIGLLLWSFFAEASMVGMESLFRKGFLLTKVRFPRWIIVATSVSNALLTLMVYSIALMGVIFVSRGVPSPLHVLCFFAYLVAYVLLTVGFALGASVLFLKYRDLNQIWDVALQAGFFLAPIMYPLGIIPERYHAWLFIWPVTPVLQFSRQVLVDGTIPTLRAHLLLFSETALILIVGVLLFRAYSPTVMEEL